MESSKLKNDSYGIKNDGDKFRDVRNSAVNEYMDKGKKKKKDKKVIVPKFLPGEEIVVVKNGYGKKNTKEYCLVEIIDFESTREEYRYYGIIKKTTAEGMLERVGRFITVNERVYFSFHYGWEYGKIQNINIRWLEK